MGTTPGTALIGRAEELEQIQEHRRTLKAAGALVLLEGDAGAGKTRLLEELQPTAVGAVLEYARAPYAPIHDLLAQLRAKYPQVFERNDDLARQLAPISELRPIAEDERDDTAQRKLLDALVKAFRAFAAVEPLVLGVEDAHWIDAASADALAYLAREVRGLPVMLAVTYRGGEAAESEEARALVARLTRSASVVLSLRPLGETQAMMLVNETASRTLALALRRRICDLAQGNPLLIIELTRHACANEDAFGTKLPVSLQALVFERLRHFDERDRNVLRVCAALEVFEPHVVCEVAQVPLVDLMACLQRARMAGLIAEQGDRFVFRHALIRQAISEEVLELQVAQLHARIAEYLEAQADGTSSISRLAYHYWMARNREKSETYNLRAAEAAFDLEAFDDAAQLFERAIGGEAVDARTFAVYRRLAQSYERAARYRQAALAFGKMADYARNSNQIELAAEIAMLYARACFSALDEEAALACLRQTIAMCDANAYPSAAFDLYSMQAWYLVHMRRIDDARDALGRASALREHAATLPLIRYHEASAAYQVHAFGGGTWRGEIEQALRLADTLPNDERARRYTNAMALAIASDLDDFEFALDLRGRVRAFLNGQRGMHAVELLYYSTSSWIEYVCGLLADARSTIERLLAYVHDTTIYAYWISSVGIPLALRTGDDRLLRACTRKNLLDEAFVSKDPIVFGPVASAVAEWMVAQGRASEAIALVENTLTRLSGPGNNFELLLLSARIGSAESAKRAEALLEPWTERSRSAQAVLALIRAYRSRGAARREYALSAAAAFEQLPWPLHQAQALALAGETAAACAIYLRVGASAEVSRLETMSTRKGAMAALSKRESEVANFVVQGYSNKAIAEELVLSERTIENHIASIFTKLNVRSRAEIASVVARENAASV